MMTEALHLFAAFMMGTVLGLYFFGFLRLTVQFLPGVRRQGLLIVGSIFVRNAATMFGFYLVMGGHWERLLACLLGFLLMRTLVLRWRAQPVVSSSEE